MISNQRNLGDILGDRRSSNEVAVINIDASGCESKWTCNEIEKSSLAVANFILSRGTVPGTRIAIFAANSIQYLMAYLGIMRSGCVCVPINIKQSNELIEYICNDADIKFAFVDEDSLLMVPSGIEFVSLNSIETFNDATTNVITNERDAALILYTSGSTGRPKGVVLSHYSQLTMIDAYTTGTNGDIFAGQKGMVVAPMFHMNALLFIKAFLAGGGSIVLMSKFNAITFAECIKRYGATVITGVPTMIAILHKEKANFSITDLSTVNMVFIGSAPLTEAIVNLSLEMMPDAVVLNSYGTTETGGGIFGSHPDGIKRPATTVGYPTPRVKVRIVGGTNRGVLEVNAPSAMTEYLNLPEVSAEKFKDGWYNTGDIFEIDNDGFYFFVGRADDMFVCSGENIYPGEVEKAIETYNGIIEAVVVPVDDIIRGKMPVAFVVSKIPSISEKDIQEHVKSTVAPYLYPRYVWFIDSMPLGSTNKVDRKLLTQKAIELVAEVSDSK